MTLGQQADRAIGIARGGTRASGGAIRPLRVGNRVKVVEALALEVGAVGVTGRVTGITPDGYLTLRTRGGTWLTGKADRFTKV